VERILYSLGTRLLTTKTHWRVLPTALVAMGWVCAATTVLSQPALAACPNETIRLQQVYGPSLPDCRAYEQVSPVDKNFNDAVGGPNVSEASPDGERVTFGSIGAFPSIPGASEFPIYLAARTGGRWSLHGLLPQTEAPQAAFIAGMTEDLSYELVSDSSSITFQGTLTEESTLFPPDTTFGLELAGASASDTPVLFESEGKLTPEAQEGVENVYEWVAGHVILIAPDAVPGPRSAAAHAGTFYYRQGTISQDGSRVFYTSLASGRLFMREDLGEPIPVSASTAEWRASTSDGSSVFYTEGPSGEEGLYRWTYHKGEPEPHITTIAEPSVKVQGIAGISSEGAYTYFVAKGAFPEANPNIGGKKPEVGKYNLYVWHEGLPGSISYIAALSELDETDWRGFSAPQGLGAANGEKSSRVIPDGRTLLFASILPLGSYENHGHVELFLYDASSGRLICVSCNPNGEPATENAYLTQPPQGLFLHLKRGSQQFMSRNLSNDGTRVFFETEEQLLPVDDNSLMDVYEWEAGHLYLISSGQSSSESYFGDASANGGDVFFYTRQRLVAQDQDNNVDLYDARQNGGIPAQNELAPPACLGEECHGLTSAPPELASPSTAVYQGAGTISPTMPAAPTVTAKHKPAAKPRCRRGFKRNRNGRCVRGKKAGRKAGAR
jgi:hypothetical protein